MSNLRSVSDDDLCSVCSRCVYRPGEMSSCMRDWPTPCTPDEYVFECPDFVMVRTLGSNIAEGS